MCNELIQIKRILTSRVNNLLTHSQVAERFTSGALAESSYGKRMRNYIETEDPMRLLEFVVRELNISCVHEWVYDEIELPDESIRRIKYCVHCENNWN